MLNSIQRRIQSPENTIHQSDLLPWDAKQGTGKYFEKFVPEKIAEQNIAENSFGNLVQLRY